MTNATTPSRTARVPVALSPPGGTASASGTQTAGAPAPVANASAGSGSAGPTYADAAAAAAAIVPEDDEMADPPTASPRRASRAQDQTLTGIPAYLLDTPVAQQPADGPRLDSSDRGKNRGLATDVVLPNVPLPTSWNSKDKCSLLQLTNGGMTVNYNGTGKNDGDAAAVRSNHPMHPSCGVYYFEIDIVSKGRDGYIGIGFAHAGVSTNRLPGWEPGSWGYHGDDGHSFACFGTGKPYGPTFTTGDVIGCGVNFAEGNWTAFFTKNGQSLGVAFRDLRVEVPTNARNGGSPFGQMLYPSVGLRTPGEIVEANFGQRPFRFDIESYFKETKSRIWSTIQKIPLPLPSSSRNGAAPQPPLIQRQTTTSSVGSNIVPASSQPEPNTPEDFLAPPIELPQPAVANRSVINDLVLSYLIHQGYTETAEAFAQGAGDSTRPGTEGDVDMDGMIVEGSEAASMANRGGLRNEAWVAASLMNKEIKNRQKIRDCIMDGSIDKATEMIAKLHPTVLEHPVPLPMLSKSAASRPGTPPAAETAIPPVLFYLKVRRFIDLVGLMAQKSAASAEPHTPVRGKAPAATPRTTRSRARGGSAEHVLDEAADDGMVMGTPSRNAGTAASQGDADDSMDDSEDAMELDSQGTGARNAARVSSRHRNVGSGGMAGSRPSRAEEVPATPSKRSRGSRSRGGPADETEDNLLQLVMALGQELQNEFGGDEREPYRTTLQECFSLLAYTDPYRSPLAYLLEPAAREPVANMVNSVILAVQGKPPLSALEVVYRQTSVGLDELVRQGVSTASFVNLRKDCLL